MKKVIGSVAMLLVLTWCYGATAGVDPLVEEARMLMAGTYPLKFLPRSASDGNSVVVESKNVAPGSSTSIGVYVANDEPVRSIIIPLIIRELTEGAYITSLSGSYHEESRLNSFLNGMYNGEQIWPPIINTYPYYSTDRPYGGDFGYLLNPPANPDYISPDGILFARGRILAGNNLPAGSDGLPGEGIPMLTIDVTVTDTEGVFMIDTTCAAPTNHVMLIRDNNTAIVPEFTPGIIAIGLTGDEYEDLLDTLVIDPPPDTVTTDTVDTDSPVDTTVVVDTIPDDSPVDTFVVVWPDDSLTIVDTVPVTDPVDSLVVDWGDDDVPADSSVLLDWPDDTSEVTPFDDGDQFEPAAEGQTEAHVINYPNPFNAATTIHYELTDRRYVLLEVYDLLGRRVTTLVDRMQGFGKYDVPWYGRSSSGEGVPAGIYFYRYQAGDHKVVGKMVYLK